MYTTEQLHHLHQELQAVAKNSLIVLGGSYRAQEATEDSDVDFYYICPLWKINFRRKNFKKILANHPKAHIMIVPKNLFKRGWFYVYGEDINGNLHQSLVNKKIILRNALKLAFFYYLKFLNDKKIENLYQTAKQIAIAKTCQSMSSKEKGGYPFAIENLMLAISENPDLQIIVEILNSKQNKATPNNKTLKSWADKIPSILNNFYNQSQSCLNFFLPNYALYNIKFLLKLKPLFLFANPDKMIMEKMVSLLKACSKKQLKDLEKIIFPVIML